MQVIAPVLNPAYIFATAPATVLATGDNGIPKIFGRGRAVKRARVRIEVAPTGSGVTFNLLIIDPSTGSTVTTITGGTVAAGATSATIALTPTAVPETYVLQLNVTVVGSTTPGTGISVEVD